MQTDGYRVYDYFEPIPGIVLLACMAHIRWKFIEAQKSHSRQAAKALPVMDAMERALDYAYKLWPRMRRYADDGRYLLDNNPVERGQQPTVMCRKNFLFSKTSEGAGDNAVIYSLPGSCDIVG